MANSPGANGEGRVRRRRRSYNELEHEKLYKSGGKEEATLKPDVANVRRIRIERLEGSTTRTAATPTMTSESHATLPILKSTSSHRRKKDRHRGPDEKKHRRRRKSTVKEDAETAYVYGDPAARSQSSLIPTAESKKLGREEESSESEDGVIEVEPVREPRKRKIRIVYMTEEEAKAERRKERKSKQKESSDRPRSSPESIRRSRTQPSRRKTLVEATSASLPKRGLSTRDLPPESRTSLRRNTTTSSHVPSAKAQHEPSLSGTTTTNKRSSFIGSFFGPGVKQQQEPEKLVECLTCLSDDVPRSKSAKLKCGHRMCHSCLRRIFKLSVTDPQHMPPKCCTADHIPLKHVEKLFDINFKKNWNRKFQEYSTKNRIYCPGRRCGEWIKPGNIHKEDGRKYGKCSRCKTKVCCLCNGKWHGTKDCPKDEETNRLLAAAKDAGWQRCYNCRTMVELKEGCNHMTCRCTAEFCMLCGLKWKSCNCPWFNYDAIEADRLNHMQVPVPVAAENRPAQDRPARLRRPRPPNNYHDEINERRRQERMDEALARRLQRAAIADDGDDDYQGGIGDIHGIGNGAGHFMNQDYVRAAHILTGTFDQATAAANYVMGVAQARGGPPPPPGPRRMAGRYPAPAPSPMLRRHTMREQAYNTAQGTQPSERVVPRRTRTDFESEAAVHVPPGRGPPPDARPSVLAGLGARGGNRVNAWRNHVEPGVTPAEGVLSI